MSIKKLTAGWYSQLGGSSKKEHYWMPWNANDYFMHSLCGLGAFSATLSDDPSRHACLHCERHPLAKRPA